MMSLAYTDLVMSTAGGWSTLLLTFLLTAFSRALRYQEFLEVPSMVSLYVF